MGLLWQLCPSSLPAEVPLSKWMNGYCFWWASVVSLPPVRQSMWKDDQKFKALWSVKQEKHKSTQPIPFPMTQTEKKQEMWICVWGLERQTEEGQKDFGNILRKVDRFGWIWAHWPFPMKHLYVMHSGHQTHVIWRDTAEQLAASPSAFRYAAFALTTALPRPTCSKCSVLKSGECLAYHNLSTCSPSLCPPLYWIACRVCMRDIPSCLPRSLWQLSLCVCVCFSVYVLFIISCVCLWIHAPLC